MAERRMFAKAIIDSDAFIDMPVTARLLYYDLGMRADDDGFVNSPKKIMRMVGASQDDLAILISKKFIIPFETGVVVIKHWRIHNYIRQDRKHETKYEKEMSQLTVKNNGAYTLIGDSKEDLAVIEHEPKESIGEEETARQKAYRESDLPYSFSYKIRNAFYGKVCPVCGKTMSSDYLCLPTIQHNVPISKGGKHELGNISVICQSCNASIQNNETGALNAEEVIKVWDDICQSNDGQMTGNCHTEDRDRLGKDSIGKNIYNADSDSVIDYLNEKAHTNYRHADGNRKFISARLKEGFSVDDCKTVIDKKCQDWLGTEYEQYLRPKTLFGNKFEGYLNANVRPRQKDHVVIDMPDYMRTAQQKEYDPDEELPF